MYFVVDEHFFARVPSVLKTKQYQLKHHVNNVNLVQ